MINIVCLKWGDKYTGQYVNNLYSMVRRYCTLPFNFICVTEDPAGIIPGVIIKVLPETGLKIWWNKLYLFKPGFLKGVHLYLDLDVVIHSNIDDLLTYGDDDEFVAVRDFGQPDMWFNSSVMKFNPELYGNLWTTFDINRDHYTKRFHGDQNYITAMIKGKDRTITYPDEWVWSYKWGANREKIRSLRTKPLGTPEEGKVAIFHGKPNPRQVKDDWVVENWRYIE